MSIEAFLRVVHGFDTEASGEPESGAIEGAWSVLIGGVSYINKTAIHPCIAFAVYFYQQTAKNLISVPD
jgi:hypothetical protein